MFSRVSGVSTKYGGSLISSGGYFEASPLSHGLCGSFEHANGHNGVSDLAQSANNLSMTCMSRFFLPEYSNRNACRGAMCVFPLRAMR